MKKTLGSALAVLSMLLWWPADAPGQSRIPRLNDGKPDMQGYWTNQTFTPLERPAQFKDKQFFSVEEAEAFARRALDGVKDVPRGEQVKSDADIHYDDGIWLLEGYKKGAMLRTSIVTDPADGRIPALSPEGQKRAQARAEARKGIGPFDSAQARGLSERCIYWAHEGPPILPTGYNSNLQIVQAPGTFVIQPEMMPAARIVPLDGRPRLAAAIRGYRGDSRGRWDGDTLVIETANFTDMFMFAAQGASADMKLTERFTRVSDDTLVYRFTVDDPKVWTRPWTAEVPWKKSIGPIFEHACHEGNYSLTNLLRGAREDEKRQKGASK